MCVVEYDGYLLLDLTSYSQSTMVANMFLNGTYPISANVANGEPVTITYHHQQTSLPPVVCAFHNVTQNVQALVLEGITEQTTSNLSSLQQPLLFWHTKWQNGVILDGNTHSDLPLCSLLPNVLHVSLESKTECPKMGGPRSS
jgi:hypothetical protein